MRLAFLLLLLSACGGECLQANLQRYEDAVTTAASCRLAVDGITLRLSISQGSTALYSLSLGPGASLASIKNAAGLELLAGSAAGESTDRVLQWVYWNEERNSAATALPDWQRRFNVNQAGTAADVQAELGSLSWDSATCTLTANTRQTQQWLATNESAFAARFQTQVQYRVFPDGVLRARWRIWKEEAKRADGAALSGPEYLETWLPLAAARVQTLHVGNRDYTAGSVPYYPQWPLSQFGNSARATLSDASIFSLIWTSSPAGMERLNLLEADSVVGVLPAAQLSGGHAWSVGSALRMERAFYVGDSENTQELARTAYWGCRLAPLVSDTSASADLTAAQSSLNRQSVEAWQRAQLPAAFTSEQSAQTAFSGF